MKLSRKAVLVCGLIAMTSPLAGWAETEKNYECRYSKETDSPDVNALYDNYKASTVAKAEEKAKDGSTYKKLKDEGFTVTCHELSQKQFRRYLQ